jgi:hypothetical protein
MTIKTSRTLSCVLLLVFSSCERETDKVEQRSGVTPSAVQIADPPVQYGVSKRTVDFSPALAEALLKEINTPEAIRTEAIRYVIELSDGTFEVTTYDTSSPTKSSGGTYHVKQVGNSGWTILAKCTWVS